MLGIGFGRTGVEGKLFSGAPSRRGVMSVKAK